MSSPAVFTYSDWATQYPELSAWVADPQATGYWSQAQLYVDNTLTSIIPNDPPIYQRTMLLLMVTAHICTLNASLNNAPSSPLVGRISAASEGSVNVSTQLDVPAGCPQFWAQTKYGIAFWVASSSFRSMRYVPNLKNRYNPWGR